MTQISGWEYEAQRLRTYNDMLNRDLFRSAREVEALRTRNADLERLFKKASDERDALQRVIDGYDRTPAEERATEAEVERDAALGDVERLEGALASVLAEVMTLHGKVAAVEALAAEWRKYHEDSHPNAYTLIYGDASNMLRRRLATGGEL